MPPQGQIEVIVPAVNKSLKRLVSRVPGQKPSYGSALPVSALLRSQPINDGRSVIECGNSGRRKFGRGSRDMAGSFRRAVYFYYAAAFVILIPATTYEVLKERMPKTILLICLPAYALLSWSFYKMFKTAGRDNRKP
jgi:hypothetical protein